MISKEYINELIKQWANTPQGKALIKKKTGKDYDGTLDIARVKKYGEEMRELLFNEINPLIKSIELTDIVVGDPQVGEDGLYRIEISFREGSLHRESLVPWKHPDGLRNIVLLFTQGYHTEKSIHGVWHKPSGDVVTWNRKNREPNDFLDRAVDAFNKKATGIAVAKLEGVYKKKG